MGIILLSRTNTKLKSEKVKRLSVDKWTKVLQFLLKIDFDATICVCRAVKTCIFHALTDVY